VTVGVKTSGSQTATITTEHTLATVTDAGIYILMVDVNAMVGGATPDTLELRIYGKCRSSDTERLIDVHRLIGTQSAPLFRCASIVSPHSYKVTLKQTAGTGRAYPWAVYET
jgi:hypothetical protein